MEREALDRALLDAHERQDLNALVTLYTQAGDACDAADDTDAACFYLTHAFVFALEIGHPDALALHAKLHARGRAHPIDQTVL